MAEHVLSLHVTCHQGLQTLQACQYQMQEVRRLDLGANASSGTSNEEVGAQADDGDVWSDEQSAALQVSFS